MHKRHGFTLIELLVVIAIIVALLAILMPAIGKSLYVTQTAVCASNMRQWTTVSASYAGDHFGALPRIDPPAGHSAWDVSNDFTPLMLDAGLTWETFFCPLLGDDLWYTGPWKGLWRKGKFVNRDPVNRAETEEFFRNNYGSFALLRYNWWATRYRGQLYPWPRTGSGDLPFPGRLSDPGIGPHPIIGDHIGGAPSPGNDDFNGPNVWGGHRIAGLLESNNAGWADGSVRRRAADEVELRYESHGGGWRAWY